MRSILRRPLATAIAAFLAASLAAPLSAQRLTPTPSVIDLDKPEAERGEETTATAAPSRTTTAPASDAAAIPAPASAGSTKTTAPEARETPAAGEPRPPSQATTATIAAAPATTATPPATDRQATPTLLVRVPEGMEQQWDVLQKAYFAVGAETSQVQELMRLDSALFLARQRDPVDPAELGELATERRRILSREQMRQVRDMIRSEVTTGTALAPIPRQTSNGTPQTTTPR